MELANNKSEAAVVIANETLQNHIETNPKERGTFRKNFQQLFWC